MPAGPGTIRWAIPLLLIVNLAGCAGSDRDDPLLPATPAKPTFAPGVVVADISAGTNPYHEAFRRSGPEWQTHPCHRIARMNCTMGVLDLTFSGDYDADVAADLGLWANLTFGEPYWVLGTNVLILVDRPWPDLAPGYGASYHGVNTAGAVNMACPDCYILTVQDRASLDGEPIERLARLGWVDFVTATNFPGETDRPFGQPAYAAATRHLHEAGSLFFSGSGNDYGAGVAPNYLPGQVALWDLNLPPWVVNVGGAYSECQGVEPEAGKPPEFVGNFTQHGLPSIETETGTNSNSGTSFSTPQLAGMFGRALLEVRATVAGNRSAEALWRTAPTGSGALGDGALTQEEVRQAMADAAVHFRSEDFNPACADPYVNVGEPHAGPGPSPASPAGWPEMGWGYIGAAEAHAAARFLLGGPEPAPYKAPGTFQAMGLEMAGRSALYP